MPYILFGNTNLILHFNKKSKLKYKKDTIDQNITFLSTFSFFFINNFNVFNSNYFIILKNVLVSQKKKDVFKCFVVNTLLFKKLRSKHFLKTQEFVFSQKKDFLGGENTNLQIANITKEIE